MAGAWPAMGGVSEMAYLSKREKTRQHYSELLRDVAHGLVTNVTYQRHMRGERQAVARCVRFVLRMVRAVRS